MHLITFYNYWLLAREKQKTNKNCKNRKNGFPFFWQKTTHLVIFAFIIHHSHCCGRKWDAVSFYKKLSSLLEHHNYVIVSCSNNQRSLPAAAASYVRRRQGRAFSTPLCLRGKPCGGFWVRPGFLPT